MIKRIMVTGASGQLGRKLTKELIRQGYRVRAHFRTAEKAARWCPPEAEAVYGDLLNPSWLYRAVDDCDAVIHCAAKVSLRQRPDDEMYRINVAGTAHVVSACMSSGVKRLVHISTIGAVGGSTDSTALDEFASFNLSGYGIPYFETKRKAEEIVLGVNGGTLEVVVVNPSIMISPPDRKVTRADLDRIPSWIPFYFDFGLNFVQTEDVIDGILAALNEGRAGERYLLTGENVDAKRAFALAKDYLDIRRPVLKLPHGLLYLAGLIAEAIRLFPNPIQRVFPAARLNRNLARLMRLRFYYTAHKAEKELGFHARPLKESIEQLLQGLNRPAQVQSRPNKKAVIK